jgi:hypothetical protein
MRIEYPSFKHLLVVGPLLNNLGSQLLHKVGHRAVKNIYSSGTGAGLCLAVGRPEMLIWVSLNGSSSQYRFRTIQRSSPDPTVSVMRNV